jgi:hypothetical protein
VLIRSAYSSRAVFRIHRSRAGRWCATSVDGMVGGTFFDHAAAIRFAERESRGAPLRLLDDDLLSTAGDGRGWSAPAR